MAAVISTMSVKLDLDASGFNSAMDGVGRKLDETGAKLRGIGTTLTTRLTAPIVGGFGLAVMAASDLNETLNKTNVVFGDAADGVTAWSENSATAFGMSQNEALGFASTFGNIFTSMGMAGDEAAKLSTDVVQLGADLGSFNNVPTADALEAIRAGLLGEYEPLRRFGIVLTEAEVNAKALEMGLVDANGEVTEAGKVAARQALITEKSANAQGDFAETSGSLANQMKILRARLANAAAAIGQILLPYVTRLVGFISGLVDRFGNLSHRMKVIIIVVGAVAAAIGPLLIVIGTLVGSLGVMVSMAPKVKAFMTMMRTTTMSALGPLLLIVAAIAAIYFVWTRDMFGIRTKITKWFDTFKAPGGGLDRLKAKFEELKVTLRTLYAQVLVRIKKAFDDMQKAIGRLWDRVKGPLAQFATMIGTTLVKAVNWALDNLYRLQPLIDRLGGVLSGIVALVGALFRGDWSAAWDAFKSIVENAAGAVVEYFRLGFEAIKGVASRIDWGALVSGAAGLGYKLLTYIDDLGSILWGWAKAGATYLALKLGELWDDHKDKIAAIAGHLISKIDDVGLKLWDWLKAGVGYVAGLISTIWDEHGDTIKQIPGRLVTAMGAIGSQLWTWIKSGASYLSNKLSTLWDDHKDELGLLAWYFMLRVKAAGPILWDWIKTGAGYLVGLVPVLWDRYKDDIAKLPGLFVDLMTGIGEKFWSWAKQGASWMAGKITALWDDHKDTISQLPGRFVSLMGSIGLKYWAWAKVGASWLAGKVTGLWDEHKDKISQLPGRFVSLMGSIGLKYWAWAKVGASYLATQVLTLWDKHKDTLSQLPGKLVDAMGSLGGNLYEWLKTGASNALDLATANGSELLSTMGSIGTRMAESIKSAFNNALNGIGNFLIGKINDIIDGINRWIRTANNKIPFGNPIPEIPRIGGGGTAGPGGGGAGGGGAGGGGFGIQSLDNGFGGAQTINATITINVTGVDSPKAVAQEVYATMARELGLKGAV